MDPLQYQEILHYSQQNSKLQVNSSGNVVMMPVVQLEAQSPTGLSEHVTTHIITPEQLQQASVTDPDHIQGHVSECMVDDGLGLGATDESLTDLQPEDSDGEDEEEGIRPRILTSEQRKLEFMAAVDLVPPAVLEDIQRRQKLCRAEYGNWWDRQHSTDFCLVPKSRTLQSTTNNDTIAEDLYDDQNYPLVASIGEDQTQVAAGPDAESMVEQITYLTSWPATSPPAHHSTVEVVTMPTTSMNMLGGEGRGITMPTTSMSMLGGEGRGVEGEHLPHRLVQGGGEGSYQMSFQSLREYSTGNQQ